MYLSAYDQALQAVKGGEASIFGQFFLQYRLTGTTNGAIVSGTPFSSTYNAIIEKAQKALVENEIFSLIPFEATCDNTTLQIGDVMIETGYGAQANGIYTVAQMRPRMPTLWMRTEFNCGLTRPRPDAGRSDQQASEGVTATDGYGGTYDANEWPLTLVDGMYAFVETPGASPLANVQCGIVGLNRVRDGRELGTPTDLPDAHFVVYCPLLPGQPLQVFDRIKFPFDGDKYQILSFYNTESTGLQGYIAICQKC